MSTRLLSKLIVCACAASIVSVPLPADDGNEFQAVEESAPVTPFVFDGDVRNLPAPQQWMPGDPIKEIPRRFYPPPGDEAQYEDQSVPTVDPLLEVQANTTAMTSAAFTTPTRNFPGQGFTGVNPPDTAGDVGPNHYIQMINMGGGTSVRIYDKAEPVPNVLATFALDSLGSGSCGNGLGDPIGLYDRFADRWLLTEFSGSGNNLCMYVSQTSDPVSGGWFNYQFTTPSFPDYPKYAVWPTDANGGQGSYVVTANDGGPGIFAMNRSAMLTGAASTFQRLTIPGLPGFGFEAPTPADIDGATAPPTGTPAIIMRHRDTENHSGPAAPGDVLEWWLFDVDWVTTSNTTLIKQTNIDVSEFDSALCGLSSFNCFPQPGTGTTLDPLREVIMNRLQYIHWDDYETLVGNLVTDVDGSDHGGVRWFELRRNGGGDFVLFQEGTYAIDADHRWMAASSMDQSGNIALAYNVSSTSTFPSLRFTGRLADDPLNAMTQPESVIHAGTASNGSNRYGDYAAMNLDPADDCTFWFTGEDNTSSSWRTQIASFRFDACGCELSPSAPSASASPAGDNMIEVAWDDSDLPTVIEYDIGRSFTSGGPYETIATVTDTSPGIAGGAGYVFSDTDVSGGSTYFYVIRSTDGLACSSEDSNEASATATGACTLAPQFGGLVSAVTPYEAFCSVDLTWNPGIANCGGPLTYNIYRSTIEGFTPSGLTLLVPGVTGTSFADALTLDNGVSYYYVVRAVDSAIAVEESNLVEIEAVPEGPLTIGTWIEDGGDTGIAKMSVATPWSLNPTEGDAGPAVYKTGDYGDLTCASITSPELLLGVGSQLSFSSQYDIEPSWDKGEVQISTDGSSWQRVPLAYPGNSTQTADQCGLPTGTYFTGTDLSYDQYVADLSAFDNQNVQIRFAMSSDTSVTESGWWIDDINITQVNVPGICQTIAGCLDNPFVDITPDSGTTVCVGEEQVLTANTSGGSGPFVFQWTRDGVNIDGATTDTLSVNDLGTHVYNCKVKAASCTDGSLDPADTQITWTGMPAFDGVLSVTNPAESTCTLDVSWQPASSVCPGPVTYSIYRDTSSPVALTAGNLVASGVSGTSFADSLDLVTGTPYFYVVRAVEQTTGASDTNVVEAGATPTAGAGLQTIFSKTLNGPGGFFGWNVSTGPGPHSCGAFSQVFSEPQRPAGSDGHFALADSQACGGGSTTSTIFTSAVIDADVSGASIATLEFDLSYNHGDGDDATVEVWDGAAWQVVWTDANADVDAHQALDVTAHALGNSNFRVRFNYQNAAFDGWFAVDNVVVTVDTPCSTDVSGAAPPPVPDGSLSPTPLLAGRVSLSGDAVDVTWDAASCPAASYDLIFGDLADVSIHLLGGAECAVGTSGLHNWTGVPSGDLYFLLVGTDGAGIESSWGTDSNLDERNGLSSSNQCSTFLKNLTQTCP